MIWPDGTFIHLYNGGGTAGGFEINNGAWIFVPHMKKQSETDARAEEKREWGIHRPMTAHEIAMRAAKGNEKLAAILVKAIRDVGRNPRIKLAFWRQNTDFFSDDFARIVKLGEKYP